MAKIWSLRVVFDEDNSVFVDIDQDGDLTFPADTYITSEQVGIALELSTFVQREDA